MEDISQEKGRKVGKKSEIEGRMFMHSFNPYLLSAHIMTGTVLGTRNVTEIRQIK